MLGAEAREANKAWLMQQVNHVLEPLMLAIVREKPTDTIKYMVDHMEREFGERALNGDKSQAAMLQVKINELERKLETQRAAENSTADSKPRSDVGSENETDSDDEDDYVDVLPAATAKKNMKPRASVSAEAFGVWNQKAAFKPKVVAKADNDKLAIREKLNMAFMFQALDESEKDIIVDAMEECKIAVNDPVIVEGTEGDCLYVIGSGTLSCSKIFPGKSDPTFLKAYQPGEAFGELALLYNAPRAATITANEDCLLWKLDRDTFNHIVKDASSKRREKYESFLAMVPIFETMEPYERSKLADAFTEIKVKTGENIITEGQPGNELFLL